jgi:REP element-mobilizing transposase RayT
MTRLRRIETLHRFFFVTFNLDKSADPLQPAERTTLLSILHRLRGPNDFALYGYVVMPTHAHILLRPNSIPLPTIMRLLKTEATGAFEKSRPLSQPLWHRSYHDFICRRARDFTNKLEYIHENPKAAGLVIHPAEWQWSSYLYYQTKAKLQVPIDEIDFSGDPNQLLWPSPSRRL